MEFLIWYKPIFCSFQHGVIPCFSSAVILRGPGRLAAHHYPKQCLTYREEVIRLYHFWTITRRLITICVVVVEVNMDSKSTRRWRERLRVLLFYWHVFTHFPESLKDYRSCEAVAAPLGILRYKDCQGYWQGRLDLSQSSQVRLDGWTLISLLTRITVNTPMTSNLEKSDAPFYARRLRGLPREILA